LIRHPGIAGNEFAKIAIDVAKQLQNLFNKDSETYKVLELGWLPEADFIIPSGELESASELMPPETLTARAATMQPFKNFLDVGNDCLESFMDL